MDDALIAGLGFDVASVRFTFDIIALKNISSLEQMGYGFNKLGQVSKVGVLPIGGPSSGVYLSVFCFLVLLRVCSRSYVSWQKALKYDFMPQ